VRTDGPGEEQIVLDRWAAGWVTGYVSALLDHRVFSIQEHSVAMERARLRLYKSRDEVFGDGDPKNADD
jgi:hypothetical protein